MRFDLVAMPWMRAEFPSMALSRLRPVLTGAGCDGVDHYVNLRWLSHLIDRFGGEGGRLFTTLIDSPGRLDLGSWVFARAYWAARAGDHQRRMPELERRYLEEVAAHDELSVETIRAASDDVVAFCDLEAQRILTGRPDVIGFTTTFQQTYPSLALAQALKRASPGTPIVFGGANCDGEMGAGLLDAFPDLDYSVSGEADHSITLLVDLLGGGRVDPDDVPGLNWRDGDRSRTSVQPSQLVDLDALPDPVHDAFFDEFEELNLAWYVTQPGVVAETSRGCWWGAKKHCTFCGLNGHTMSYRAESGARAIRQIVGAVERHQAPNVVVVDNILDRAYFDDVLPQLAALDYDLSIFYEIRADLSADEIRALAAAGVRIVQPGIESLGTNTLRLMRKSTTGARQVQVLRDLHNESITVAWNYLYGFPGEEWQRDYAPIVRQLPHLVHLAPPSSSRIDLQRFSPNHTDPSLGFRPIGPPALAECLHPGLSRDQVMRVTYRFSAPQQGCTDDEVAPLQAAISAWQDGHRGSSLMWRRTPDGEAIVIRDRRAYHDAADFLLDPLESAIHDLVGVPLSPATIVRSLVDAGHDVDTAEVQRVLDVLSGAGLVFTDGTSWVRLATEARAAMRPSPTAQRRRLAVSVR